MDLGLSGKRAIVTGSTKGLGRAIAETLLDEGASVAICARDAEGVEQAVAELSGRGSAWGRAVDAASDALAASGNGALISIGTSAVSEHFASGANSYTAFKAAVTNWTLGQAQVLGARGVRCNVVSPGPIWVDGGDWNRVKEGRPEFFEATQKTHPMGKLGEVQDVANAVVFLASPAAKHINGANLTVDGGYLKRVDF